MSAPPQPWPPWTAAERLVLRWDQLCAARVQRRRRPVPVGVDGITAARFEAQKHARCAEISRRLRRPDPDAGRPTAYRFAPLIRHEIETEPGKRRRIHIPRVRDQLVIRCLYDDLTAAMVAADMPRGLPSPQGVARRVIASRNAGRRHVARLDIRGFYDSVQHGLLLDALQALPLSPLTRDLIGQVVTETPHRPFRGTRADDRRRRVGLPTGLSIATVLAELYLQPLDRLADQLEGVDTHRFVDDLVLQSADWDALYAGVRAMADGARTLRLELHGNKSHFATFDDGFDFLGFRYRGSRVVVSDQRIRRWRRRFEQLYRATLREHPDRSPGDQLQTVVARFNREICGVGSRHIPYYAIVDDLEVYRDMDRFLRRVVGGLARKAGTATGLVSCHAWAWRYKKAPEEAATAARALFPDDPAR